MALNKELLRYFMAKHKDTTATLSEKLDMGTASFNNRMNGTTRSRFTIEQAQKIRELYHLTDQELLAVFFAEEDSNDDR